MFVGELLKVIGRKLLHLPVMRFVDDYFAVERKGCEEHAMNIFARWVFTICVPALNAKFEMLQANKSSAGRRRRVQEKA